MVIVTALPLYHIFALTACLLFGVSSGGMCILIPNPRDIPGLIKELAQIQSELVPGGEHALQRAAQSSRFRDARLERLKCAVAGGMAVQKSVAEAWMKATGKPIIEGYGLSETSPVLTCNRGDIARMDRHHRPAAALDRNLDPRRRRPRSAARRGRRDLRARAAGDARLLAAAGRDREGDDRGRLLPHRRHRHHGRAGPRPHRRPQEGHDHASPASRCSRTRSRTSR